VPGGRPPGPPRQGQAIAGRHPDGTEDSPPHDCFDVAHGSQRLNTITDAYEGFLDRVCGTDDLSSNSC
jgi:hypothetical protein